MKKCLKSNLNSEAPSFISVFINNFNKYADKKWGKGKDKLDDEDIAFQRMVAKVRASPLLSLTLFV